ncbi:CLUMA_CG017858, isoform A [Clunio marinus]|uniref:CLUMA_CG017858, isoform A n=1 Tax=Clunio marinus TaxID=568069 RepID=A0A1J1IZ28_9DIPT|nr:CLUMA_CG017858, isoform A [Clunio marinus]
MVMSADIRDTNRNGKRSRGSSPSTTSINSTSSKQPPTTVVDDLTPETSDDDTHSKKNLGKAKNGKNEFEEKIRVGKDYQVVVPEKGVPLEHYLEKALLVWSPGHDIPDNKIDEYITLAKETYGYNSEQALGMLFWHKHNLEEAVIDLANFTPFSDEWSKEDKVLFEQAFQFHGKCFHRIRQMLPDKSIASLVKFYYSWKKTRSRTSVMDRQEKKKREGVSENGSENGSPEDSDIEDKKWPIRGIRRTSRSPNRLQSPMNSNADNASTSSTTKSIASKAQDVKRYGSSIDGKGSGANENNKDTGYSSSSSSSNGVSKLSSQNCQNCTVLCDGLKSTPIGSFCYHDGSSKYKRKPPKGMYINHDDVLKLAAQDLNAKDTPRKQTVSRKNDLLVETDREITVLYGQIQTNKQKISSLKSRNEFFGEGRLHEEVVLNRVNNRWTKDETALALMGFQRLGQEFKAIAEIIGTKTESHVRKFFMSNRKSRNLDVVCQEASAQKTKDDSKQNENIEIMEIDSDDDVQVKEVEVLGNLDNVGLNASLKKDNDDIANTSGKTSIMTTSTGKTLKRKHSDDVCVITDDGIETKKINVEKSQIESNSEITITPIPKVSDDKTNGKEIE